MRAHSGIKFARAIRFNICPKLLISVLFAARALAQFDPAGAQVNLYFPQLADGGTPSLRWQTSFIFSNPNPGSTAYANVTLHDDNGNPLSLDFGAGLTTTFSFSIPPQGTRTFRSTMSSSSTVTGWAYAGATLPLQATVLYREIVNGVPKVEISAQATLPSAIYRSPANNFLGVAIANPYSGQSIKVGVAAIDANGNRVGTGSVTLGPNSHSSFNLFQLIPNLSNFSGSVEISSTDLNTEFVAWTLNADSSGVISSLPPGPLAWPVSHWDRIWLVFNKVLNAALQLAPRWGIDLTAPVPALNISSDPNINARGGSDGITVYYALSELISDSPSELAFVIGHEFGHVVQGRIAGPGGTLVPLFPPISPIFAGIETDADRMGLILSLAAGYDPYASAGALGKLAMASGQAGLEAEGITDIEFLAGQLGPDPHPSWGTRIDLLFQTLTTVCSDPQYASACSFYRSQIHGNFPPNEPLSVGGNGSPGRKTH